MIGLNPTTTTRTTTTTTTTTTQARDELVTDDTIRFYLRKIGEYPLLSREQEIKLAERIETSRKGFRHALLESEFAIQSAVRLLQAADAEEMRLDKYLPVAAGKPEQRERILRLFETHLPTLAGISATNTIDYDTAVTDRRRTVRELAWRNLVSRRRRAVRLIEEFGIRMSFVRQLHRHWNEWSLTERTATAVYPVLDRKASVISLLRLWCVVIIGNLAGAAVSGYLLTAADPVVGGREGYLYLGHHLVAQETLPLLLSVLLAGMANGDRCLVGVVQPASWCADHADSRGHVLNWSRRLAPFNRRFGRDVCGSFH